MFLLHHFQNFPLKFNFHIVSSCKFILSQWFTWSSCRCGIKNSTYYTQQVAQAYTETDQEQVGDLDSNIHQSCCQRLCILNQPACNNEWKHIITTVKLNYNWYSVYFSTMSSSVNVSLMYCCPFHFNYTSLWKTQSIQNTLSNTVIDECMKCIIMQEKLTAVSDCHPWTLITLPIIPSPPMEDNMYKTLSWKTEWFHNMLSFYCRGRRALKQVQFLTSTMNRTYHVVPWSKTLHNGLLPLYPIRCECNISLITWIW